MVGQVGNQELNHLPHFLASNVIKHTLSSYYAASDYNLMVVAQLLLLVLPDHVQAVKATCGTRCFVLPTAAERRALYWLQNIYLLIGMR
jgi:hypothetical protein